MTEISSAAAPSPKSGSSWRRLLLLLLVVFLAAVWFLHPLLLDRLILIGLQEGVKGMGFKNVTVQVEKMRTHLAGLIVLEGIQIRPAPGSPTETQVRIERVAIARSSVWNLLFGAKRPLEILRVDGARGVLDFRTASLPPFEPLPEFDAQTENKIARLVRWIVPRQILLREVTLGILADGQQYLLENLNLEVSEAELGRIWVARTLLDIGPYRLEQTDNTAVLAWKNAVFYLADLSLNDQIQIDNFSADLAHPGGVALTLDARLYGGLLRADVSFGVDEGLLYTDAALWLADINLEPFASHLENPVQAQGSIREAKVVYRGSPDALQDSQVQLRLAAEQFRWKNRGWETLTLSGSLMNRRIEIADFALRQRENQLRLNGEWAIPISLEEIKNTPVLLNISADLQDLASLGALLGEPWQELSGRLTLRASVSGRPQDLQGFLSSEASELRFRALDFASSRLEVAFANREARIAVLDLWGGASSLQAKGSVSLFAPYRYSGELDLRLADLAKIAQALEPAAALPLQKGSLQFQWQGDGTASLHSGAFEAHLDEVVSEWTPGGLSGQFAGTYSPQNLYLRTFRLLREPFELTSNLTFSAAGINITNLNLRTPKTHLMGAEGFLPLNPFAIVKGAAPAAALVEGRPLYLRVESAEIPIEILLALAGQDIPAQGTVRLDLNASGPLDQVQFAGQIRASKLSLTVDEFTLPETNGEAAFAAVNGRGNLTGNLTTTGFKPFTLKMEFPFGLTKSEDGQFVPADLNGPMEAVAVFPETDIRLFQPFLPKLRRLSGVLNGEVRADNSLLDPRLHGAMRLKNGLVMVSGQTPALENLEAELLFAGQTVDLKFLRGSVGAGPFELTGRLNFASPGSPALNARLTGQKVLLARDPGLRLRANLNLEAKGNLQNGTLSGSIGLVDGRIFRRLQITPLIVQGGVEEELPATVVPDLTEAIPPPWANWKLDVGISNDEPFLMVGNLASGEIIPALRIQGTLAKPLPIGSVRFRDALAYLPFTTVEVTEGSVDFVASEPGVPLLNIRGRAEMQDYEIQLFAHGPLSQRQLVLRSDPPLPQEDIVRLLTTGFVPGTSTAGAGFGQAAIGQGSLLLMRAFLRQFETGGVNLNSFLNRLSVTSTPPLNVRGNAILQGRYRLTDQFSVLAERDELGFINGGVSYTIRLK